MRPRDTTARVQVPAAAQPQGCVTIDVLKNVFIGRSYFSIGNPSIKSHACAQVQAKDCIVSVPVWVIMVHFFKTLLLPGVLKFKKNEDLKVSKHKKRKKT